MAAYPESLDGNPPPPPVKRLWWRFVERRLPMIIIYLMVATLLAIVILPNMVVTVPTGNVGVLWKRFRGGTQVDPALLRGEGLRIILPWDKLFLYSLQLQTTTDSYNAISKDGVNLTATINIRFRLKHDAVPQLHQGIGTDYIAKLLRPEIGNRMREIIAEYTAEEVYSSKRQEIQKRIRTHTEAMLGQSMMERKPKESDYGESYRVSLDALVNIYDTLILGLELPQPVVAAINRKVEQYYLVQEYAFRVDREKRESERKQIEAQGIAAFQQTVAQGISDSYLRWRGIEATLQLAQSNNSKVVIIGNAKDGMPIILGNVDTPNAPQPAGSTPGGNNGASTIEAPTGTSPSPTEKTPASNLSTPMDRQTSEPQAPADKTTGAPEKRSDAAPPGSSSSWPRPLSDIDSLITRLVRSAEPAPQVPAAERPAATPGPTAR